MQTMYLDGLKIHDSTGPADITCVTPIEGLDVPELRVSQYDKPGEHGSAVSNMLYGGRVITLTGRVRGDNAALLEANRQLLTSACAIESDSFGAPQAKQLQFTTSAGITYIAQVYVRKLVMPHEYVLFANFMIELTTADPLIYGTHQVVSSPITRPTGGGFVLPVILPIVSSSQTGGSVVVANPGTATVKPVITITGPLSNPYISNAAADGKYLQLNATLNSGDVVTVDMAEKTIVLNGSSNYLATRTSDSEWWGIAPGNNTISFSTAGTSDSGTMQVSFYPGYVGV